MSPDGGGFEHALLGVPTPKSWVHKAVAERRLLILDHANCEKKAASTALALMFAYGEDLDLVERLSRLAREELRHYEQVARLIRSLGIAPQRLAPGRYALELRRLVSRAEPGREVDLMVCGAFIEARSAERFAAVAPALDSPLKEFFEGLHAAEARHYKLYLDLARRAAERAHVDLAARIAAFAAHEAELIESQDPLFRFHSGAPC